MGKAITDIPGLYSPRIDIAIGPFSTIQGNRLAERYDHMMLRHQTLINRLIELNQTNFRQYQNNRLQKHVEHQFSPINHLNEFNNNARCFIAIEIENRVSRKHLLGGVVNASALARIGIVIPWTTEKLRAVIRLLQYWDYLKYVGKNTFNADNVLILTSSQLANALQIGNEE